MAWLAPVRHGLLCAVEGYGSVPPAGFPREDGMVGMEDEAELGEGR